MFASAPAANPPVSSGPMCRVMSAVDCCSDCRSVFTARNSTPSTSASTMRLTAFTPAPPTPTTRITGCPTVPAPFAAAGCSRAYPSITGRAAWRSITFSGISEEKACRNRSRGVGTFAFSPGVSGDALSAGWGRPLSRGCTGGGSDGESLRGAAARLRLASAGGLDSAVPGASSASVLRNSAASGPSRMLARCLGLAMSQDLLRELPVGLRRDPVRLVLQHRHALHRRLGEAHRLADARGEHAIAEVLLQDLDRLLGVDRARIDQRRKDTLDVDARVEVLADHREGVLQLDEPAHRQILALHGSW